MLSTTDFNALLQDSEQGDAKKTALLFPIVYDELKRIANKQMRGAWSVGTIQATVLVNEAYLKLLGHDKNQCQSKTHFFAICAKAMRQVLLNYVEQKQAKKRGLEFEHVTYAEAFHQDEQLTSCSLNTLLTIDQALVELAQIDEDLCKLVELRFFAGLTESEIADLTGVSERTVRRNWQKAKALMSQALAP